MLCFNSGLVGEPDSMLLGGLGGFCLGLISCSFVVVLLSNSVLALQTGGEVNPTPESSLQTV
jgi:hypothetical protein